MNPERKEADVDGVVNPTGGEVDQLAIVYAAQAEISGERDGSQGEKFRREDASVQPYSRGKVDDEEGTATVRQGQSGLDIL